VLKTAIASIVLSALAANLHAQTTDHSNDDAQRQAEVAGRGKDVMPFSLAATTHVFTKTAEGGIQQVVAKKPADAAQVQWVRLHLQDIRERFLKGDFSGPAHIHGQDMPGLADLKAAKPGQIAITYKDIEGGAELAFKTSDPALIAALHQWFDAQLSDHGKDAMEGDAHHGWPLAEAG
jgi:hypothetical protein